MTVATGGTVTGAFIDGVPYRIHTFSTSDDFVVTEPGDVEYLLVAGGGGGGGGSAGGGGGGGVLIGTATVEVGTFPVVVGTGGAGGDPQDFPTYGTSGTNSSFNELIAVGGGAGAGALGSSGGVQGRGVDGGSGGGGAGFPNDFLPGGDGTTGQGFAGGLGRQGDDFFDSAGGGGGGASQVGGDAALTVGGNGGNGIESSLTGASVVYGGGGGGAANENGTAAAPGGAGGGGAGGFGIFTPTSPTSGVDGLGGGGGGGRPLGGDGGNGIVIIRYAVTKWVPNPRVEIDGVDFTDQAIDRVRVTVGRQTVYDRTNAGYASIGLRDIGDMPPFAVGEQIIVRVNDAFNISQPIFTGLLSDWNSEIVPAGNGPVVVYGLQAVGPLATLNRRVVFFDGRIAEDEAERVEATLTAALGTADPSIIDTGLFQIAALGSADAGYNALQVAQIAAVSGEGLLFETPDGFIGYDNADRRLNNEKDGPFQIPFGALSAEGLGVIQQLADITNQVTVTYDGGAVTETNASSIADFGLYETNVATQLDDESDAELRAIKFLQRHASPRPVFDRLRLNVLSLTDDLRVVLFSLRQSSAITVTGVPARVGFTEFRGFVEGLEFDIEPFNAVVRLVVSDRRLSIDSQRWEQVDATIEWQDVEATLTWEDAEEVTT